jgi:hypothetical protein
VEEEEDIRSTFHYTRKCHELIETKFQVTSLQLLLDSSKLGDPSFYSFAKWQC